MQLPAFSVQRSGYHAFTSLKPVAEKQSSAPSPKDPAIDGDVASRNADRVASDVGPDLPRNAIAHAHAVAARTAEGLSTANKIVGDIREKLVLAATTSTSRDRLNSAITKDKEQLRALAEAAAVSGDNWLKLDVGRTPGPVELVSAVNLAEDGTAELKTIDFDTTGTALISDDNPEDGILTSTYDVFGRSGDFYSYHLIDNGAISDEIAVTDEHSHDEISGMIEVADRIRVALREAGERVGAVQDRLAEDDNTIPTLIDSLELTSASGTDDTETETKATDIRTQLLTMMLNIANSDTTAFRKLFA
jgi:flagellin